MKRPEGSDGRLAEAFARLAERVPAGEDCPSSESLWDAATGAASPKRTRSLGLHAVGCPACAEAWRLARELSIAAKDSGAAAAPERRPASGRRAWWGLAAAAALLLGALLVLDPSLPSLRGDPPVFRNRAEATLDSRLEEESPLRRDAFVLKWQGPEGAVYGILVADETLRPIARAESLAVGEFTVPADALKGIESGERVVWQVSARLPDGRTLRSRSFVALVE